MPLPAPNLDDRRFQDLVDDAKRLVQQRCPEWTDHNVSDPGVTLIETFASMFDQLLYRLNRVPDRNYVKFLDLIGVRLFPPTAARVGVTFWLSAPQDAAVRIPAGTQVATLRTEVDEAIQFTTVDPLDIVPCSLTNLASSVNGEARERFTALEARQSFFCFDDVPKPDDALLIGLSGAVPLCAVALRFECEIEGVGVDPRRPPLVWEAWDGTEWAPCDLERDDTGGLNRAGDVVIHVHAGHVTSVINNQRAGWLRCRVVAAEEGQPSYSASPRINRLSVHTVGGTATAVNAEVIEEEILGTSENVPGQRFLIARRPVVPGDGSQVLEVSGEDGWTEWEAVDNFADSSDADLHFVLDGTSGEVVLGPAVRESDGSLRQYGAVPPKGAVVRLRAYRTGGGRRGNVARGAITVLRSSIPYVTRVGNRRGASGGVDGESVERAKERAPIVLRTRNRAVTAEDYEQLAREAAPEIARVRCVGAGAGADAGAVRVLLIPAVPDASAERLRLEELIPLDATLERVAAALEERRIIGARITVEQPLYLGVTVVAQVRARRRIRSDTLRDDALTSLNAFLHPLNGGAEGGGWPFGRGVHIGDIYAVLQGVRGVELVEDVRLFAANPITGERGDAVQQIDIDANALVFSYEHQVRVVEATRGSS
jgi:predicted phage baseplate assembly protein